MNGLGPKAASYSVVECLSAIHVGSGQLECREQSRCQTMGSLKHLLDECIMGMDVRYCTNMFGFNSKRSLLRADKHQRLPETACIQVLKHLAVDCWRLRQVCSCSYLDMCSCCWLDSFLSAVSVCGKAISVRTCIVCLFLWVKLEKRVYRDCFRWLLNCGSL